LVISYYLAFTDSFVENYCVNKDKPELQCDGKCELSKLLDRNSSENDRQEKMMLLTSFELILFLNHSEFHCLTETEIIRNRKTFFIPEIYTFNFSEKLIKPPKGLV